MKETKPHPGPWMVEGIDIRCKPDEQDAGTVIAEMVSSRSIRETRHNAMLIAAAPDLLAAVELFMACRSSDGAVCIPNDSDFDAGAAAIAKAKGVPVSRP